MAISSKNRQRGRVIRVKNNKKVSSIRTLNRRKRSINKFLSELEELSIFDDYIEQNTDLGIKFAGNYNVLTFNDEYIENLRKFSH